MKIKLMLSVVGMILMGNFMSNSVGANPATLTGFVYDASGAPISNQQVYIYVPGNDPVASTVTAPDGSYSLSAETGTYALTIAGKGSNANTDFSRNVPLFYQVNVTDFNLTENSQQNITLPLKEVTVAVKDIDGNPIFNAEVSTGASSFGPQVLAPNLTSADGDLNYAEGIGPKTDVYGNAKLWLFSGSYNFKAIPPSGSTFETVSVNNVSITQNTTVTMNVKQTVSLTGFVRDSLGNAVSNQQVDLYVPGAAPVSTAVTAFDGSYTLTAQQGTYAITVSGKGSRANNDFSKNIPQFYQVNVTEYNLSANSQQDITLPVKEVNVLVKDTAGNGVANVEVSTGSTGFGPQVLAPNFNSTDGDNNYPEGIGPKTDDSGNVKLWLFSGDYNFKAVPGAGSTLLTNSASNVAVTNNMSVEITLEEKTPAPTNLSAVTPSNAANLTWQVVTSASSYNVYRNGTLIASSTQNSYSDTTSPEGNNTYVVKTVNSFGESLGSNAVTVLIDRTIPVASNLVILPRLNVKDGVLTVTANAADNLSGVLRGELYFDTDPGLGNGITMPFSNGMVTTTTNVSGLSKGQHTVYVRVLDAAGNWSATISTQFRII